VTQEETVQVEEIGSLIVGIQKIGGIERGLLTCDGYRNEKGGVLGQRTS
jgi:hypothetical protein